MDRTHARLLGRRTWLKSAGLAALLAPILRRATPTASAAGPTAPRRVIFFFSPNGPMSETGPCTGTSTDFSLHDWWSPLEPHKSKGIFFSHLASTGAGTVDGNGHGLGGQTFGGFGAGFGGDQYAQNGPTIDQIIATRLESKGIGGVRPSVVWGNYSNSEAGGTGDAFATEGGRNIRPVTSPLQAWNELFSAFMPPTEDPVAKARAAARLAKNKSVLDFALRDCEGLESALGSEGAALFAQHCDTIRSLEKGLSATLTSGGDCKTPSAPPDIWWQDPNNIDLQSTQFVELMKMTLACELSHVISYQVGAQAARNRLADSYGVPSSPQADSGDSGPAHHPWTHQDFKADIAKSALGKFYKFYSGQVASIISMLETTNDASGKPLLDSTLLVWFSELGGNAANGDPHQTSSVPAMVFGSGQGTLRNGLYIRGASPETDNSGPDYEEAGRQSARLLLSVAHYMGLGDLTTIGNTKITGPYEELYL